MADQIDDADARAVAEFRAEYTRLMQRRRALILTGVSESELEMPDSPDVANPPIFVANE